MLLLGYDFELTGLDREFDRIIEVGAIVWDTDAAQPVRMLSSFVYDESYPETLTDEITVKTGITLEVLKKYGVPPKGVFATLNRLASKCDILVAHNGEDCDFPFWRNECKRQEVAAPDKFRIDTMLDVPYPMGIVTRKLSYLAAEHGFLNPFPHRALFDVMTMMQILSRYSLKDVMRASCVPMLKIVSCTPFEDRQLSKDAKYQWDGEKKMWWKNIRETELNDEKSKRPFPIQVIEKTDPRNKPTWGLDVWMSEHGKVT